MRHVPQKILRLAETVRERGGRALLVGGCVRDHLMNRASKDWDVEVYGVDGAALRALLERFGPVNAVGESFTVYKLGGDVDVSLPRRERKVGRGHKGFVVEGDSSMSVEEAARRRDFTVNAILCDPLDGEIIDPFGGRRDIARGTLRMVARETFAEDSLRVLRAAQFAARFEFEIEPETFELCRVIDLTDLPAERVWGEVEKMLLAARRPSVGFRCLEALGVFRQLFPELQALVGVPQEFEWHPEGTVDVHTWLVLDQARSLVDDLPYGKRVTVMLAALCHDLGKPATTKFAEGRWRSLGHDAAGLAPTARLLDRLNVHTLGGYDVRAQVLALVAEHLRPGEFYARRDEISGGAFRRLSRRCELELLYLVAKADSLGRNAEWVPRELWHDSAAQEWFIGRARELSVASEPPAPLLMGRHLKELGLPPSPQFKKILDAVYEQQLDGHVRTPEEAIALARRIINPKGAAEDGQS